jgi:hypothetical protein
MNKIIIIRILRKNIFIMKFLNNTNEYWLWEKESNFGINEFLFSLILKKISQLWKILLKFDCH